MDKIEFKVNGQKCSVGGEVSSDVTLLDYLRKTLELRGTKYMCMDGSCGACIVTAVIKPGSIPVSVNSCLVSVMSCEDWDITTVEKIGNKLAGYHPIQKRLAEVNGTQCGYCTPGMVMSMYSLKQNPNFKPKSDAIEQALGSNVCRCTGYRSIIQAFRTIPKDLTDIEDLSVCQKTGNPCKKDSCSEDEWCFVDKNNIMDNNRIVIKLKDNKTWYRVTKLSETIKILNEIGTKAYMLLAGNTAKGIYPISEYPENLIDISGVEELKSYKLDKALSLGSGNTLSEIEDIFKKVSSTANFGYLNKFSDHLETVAHIPVKNIATVGGNLMLKNQYKEFQSDLFVLFETVGATIKIVDKGGSEQDISVQDFINTNMEGKIIKSVELPSLDDDNHCITYKVMPRSQNALAHVNAGFLYKLDKDGETVSAATIVYGGISYNFIHASKTESYLIGKNLFKNETLQGALSVLREELVVEGYPEIQIQGKKKLAIGIFYKALLSLYPSNKLNPRYKSGAITLYKNRPASLGDQNYDTYKTLWPLTQPIPKVEALIQCSGEAPYVDDVPTQPQEVFAAFVLSDCPVGEIDAIDPKPALDLEGVIAFYTAKDIPGTNSFTPTEVPYNYGEEEILCDGKVKYNGQPVGIIVAESEHLAERSAKLVKITYKNVKIPVITLQEAKKESSRVSLFIRLPASNRGTSTTKVIKGSNYIQGQYHYHMEKQVCLTKPSDDGIEVMSSTECMESVQIAISQALNITENSINLSVRRIGGGFGAKLSRATEVAVACSLVTLKLNRACRMILPITTNMTALGKRLPSNADFEVGVDARGIIQYLEYSLYEDNGYMVNEPFIALALPAMKNLYNSSRWNFRGFNVVTDTAKNSWAKSSGTLEVIAMTEYIMERISYELSLDPIGVRLANLPSDDSNVIIRDIINTLKKDSEYDKRKEAIKKFNDENRWKKRGIRIVPIKWPVPIVSNFNVTIAIHHSDKTVVVTHGGVESEEGINTKVIQVCASSLHISMDKISVKATNNITNINGMGTYGSYTSEVVCLGVIKCCDVLMDRMSPLKILVQDATFDILVELAYRKGINLVASHNVTVDDQKKYDIYGAALSEVEMDVLTGEIQVSRVDLLEDVGRSLNPEIDSGLIEGAFVMGIGYWTSEQLFYEPKTGKQLTDRTSNYYVPLATDIPLKYIISFKSKAFNNAGTLGAKACADPSICMAISVPFAIREAMTLSRLESGIPTTTWFDINGPYTIDNILNALDVKIEEFKFY